MYADNVLVELDPVETVSAGGIHLVQTCQVCGGKSWIADKQAGRVRCRACAGTGVAGKQARGSRLARVIASGPGHYAQKPGECRGTVENGRQFIPNQTKEGDRVIVDALAGEVWEGNLSAPRHNLGSDFGERRIVRESEILGILEPVQDVG